MGLRHVDHHYHHHKHQGLDPLIRSAFRITTALAKISSVYQLFSFLVVCSEVSYHQTYSARDWLSILRTPYTIQNFQRKHRTDLHMTRGYELDLCSSGYELLAVIISLRGRSSLHVDIMRCWDFMVTIKVSNSLITLNSINKSQKCLSHNISNSGQCLSCRHSTSLVYPARVTKKNMASDIQATINL